MVLVVVVLMVDGERLFFVAEVVVAGTAQQQPLEGVGPLFQGVELPAVEEAEPPHSPS